MLDVHRDFLRDTGHRVKNPAGRAGSYSFRFYLWKAVRGLRDKDRWPSVCGYADSWRKAISGYRRVLMAVLETDGKEALNKKVRFFGVAIAECDELLELCGRLSQVDGIRKSNHSTLAEAKWSEYEQEQGEWERVKGQVVDRLALVLARDRRPRK